MIRVLITTTFAAIGTLLLPPNNVSHALSSTKVGSRILAADSHSSSPVSCSIVFSRRHEPKSSLRAIAENTIPPETCHEADGSDVPTPTIAPQILTGGAAGRGARVTPGSRGVAVEQDFWSKKFDEDDSIFGDTFPTPDGTTTNDRDKKVVIDYDPFPDGRFHGDDVHTPDNNDIINTYIKNEIDENSEVAESNMNELDGNENKSTEDLSNEKESSNSVESDDSVIRSAMAKSALLHRAGIAGGAKKSSRSNGRSSRARTHVNKSKRGSSRTQGVGAMGRVLGTVRTAAGAAAAEVQKKSLENNVGGSKSGENAKGDNNLTTNNSLAALSSSSIQSTVADMLKHQDAAIQQQSVRANTSSPPPGTASMGLLGEVVQDDLPITPPLPGTFLLGAHGDVQTAKPRTTIRSSIPHSPDDIHIANLRLSVFSRFDQEQQRLFRSRSVEVLNVRRRRGAVVLVAEVPKESGRDHHQNRYLTEMQARIVNGHTYGGSNNAHAFISEPSMPSSADAPVHGARIASVSTRVAVDFDQNLAFSTIGTSAVCDDNNKENLSTLAYHSEEVDRGSMIIGSVECSHQEFRGTMLGNSRPKGALMYVTEVAVRPDARRCGAGAMLIHGVDEVAALRNVETIYLHVDVTNQAACAMYEKCGYHYLDKREPIYAQFTASLNLHDGAMHGRKHYLMCKNVKSKTTWLEDDDLFSETRKGALGLLG